MILSMAKAKHNKKLERTIKEKEMYDGQEKQTWGMCMFFSEESDWS